MEVFLCLTILIRFQSFKDTAIVLKPSQYYQLHLLNYFNQSQSYITNNSANETHNQIIYDSILLSLIDYYYFTIIQFEIMEQSRTVSQQSNFFVISSESSRSEKRLNKKPTYASFVKKIKHLLDVQQDDLNQLYQKVEIIVKKYFDQHKIVEFRDMYDYLTALKFNSKKMTGIVELLEKKIIIDSDNRIKESKASKRSFKNQQFETTNSSHKDAKYKYQREEESLKQQNIDHNLTTSEAMVMTSAKYHNNKPSRNDIISINENHTPKPSKIKQEQNSPSKYSPNKLNSSFEQYQARNKKYEDKVKEIMKELEDIKKIAIKRSKQKQRVSINSYVTQSIEKEYKNLAYSQKIATNTLKIDLKENSQRQDGKSRETIIDSCNETNFIIQQKKSQIQNQKAKKVQIDRQKLTQTIQSNPQQKQKVKFEADTNLTTIKPSQILTPQTRAQNLLQYTANITKQIEELKEVASRMQISSENSVKSSQVLQSNTQLISSGTINNLIRRVSEQYKKPALEVIQNTTSKMQITQHLIPSQKQIKEIENSYVIFEPRVSTSMLRSSHIDNQSKQSINISFINNQSKPPLTNSHYFQSNNLISNPSLPFRTEPIPISNVRYSQYPYPVPNMNNNNYIIRPPPLYQPNNQLYRQGSQIVLGRGMQNMLAPNDNKNRIMQRSNSSMTIPPYQSSDGNMTTSIMHPHLQSQPRNSNSFVQVHESGFRKQGLNIVNRDNMTQSFKVANQLDHSMVKQVFNNSSNKSIKLNQSGSSQNSIQRKGLNLTSSKK